MLPDTVAPQTSVGDLYFRQLLAGKDFAKHDPIASQMRNFSYLIGDSSSRRCLVVDPAYAPKDLWELAMHDGYEIVGALITHYHADHCGGTMMGMNLAGVSELLELADVPIYVHQDEIPWIRKTTGIGASHISATQEGQKISLGSIEFSFLHTPGHTPGSQCFLVRDRLVSGDTVFLDGCGRTDLPGGNPAEMFRSLRRLAALPSSIDLYPGHDYSPRPTASLEDVAASNVVFRASNESDWLRLFG